MLFAFVIASSIVLNVWIAKTGPKISSCAITWDCETLVNKVGGHQKPLSGMVQFNWKISAPSFLPISIYLLMQFWDKNILICIPGAGTSVTIRRAIGSPTWNLLEFSILVLLINFQWRKIGKYSCFCWHPFLSYSLSGCRKCFQAFLKYVR